MIPHLLCCQGLAGVYTRFALERLESEASPTFALLGYNLINEYARCANKSNLITILLKNPMILRLHSVRPREAPSRG
jgi:hypothetical protein